MDFFTMLVCTCWIKSHFPGVPLPNPQSVSRKVIISLSLILLFTEVYDDQWLVEIEGKTSIRTLTRIPLRK
jgi:hypothetical protein